MPLDAWLTVAILVVIFVVLLVTKLPPATVFLGALTLSVTFDLAPLDRSLAGFANPAVLTIGALFMVAAGMCTLIGTATNLIIAGLVLDAISNNTGGAAKLQEITMFDPSWVAVPAMVLGLILIMATSNWLLYSTGPVSS